MRQIEFDFYPNIINWPKNVKPCPNHVFGSSFTPQSKDCILNCFHQTEVSLLSLIIRKDLNRQFNSYRWNVIRILTTRSMWSKVIVWGISVEGRDLSEIWSRHLHEQLVFNCVIVDMTAEEFHIKNRSQLPCQKINWKASWKNTFVIFIFKEKGSIEKCRDLNLNLQKKYILIVSDYQ